MRQMGQESGKGKEGMGARREDWPPTLEHREREVCFARCFYSGRSAMSANRVFQSRSGLNGGAAERPVSLRTCAHSQPMHMQSVGVTCCCCCCCCCCCALLSLNYARRTSSSASEPFFQLRRVSLLFHCLFLLLLALSSSISGTARSFFLFPGQARDLLPAFRDFRPIVGTNPQPRSSSYENEPFPGDPLAPVSSSFFFSLSSPRPGHRARSNSHFSARTVGPI